MVHLNLPAVPDERNLELGARISFGRLFDLQATAERQSACRCLCQQPGYVSVQRLFSSNKQQPAKLNPEPRLHVHQVNDLSDSDPQEGLEAVRPRTRALCRAAAERAIQIQP